MQKLSSKLSKGAFTAFLKEQRGRTVARKSSIRGVYVRAGGLDIQT